MTISKDLLLTILSMDSYNQGYGRGLEHGSAQIGTATLLGPASGVPAGQLTPWTNAGFYAAAYSTQYGTVISYRGTNADSISSIAADLANGWVTGAGVAATQADMAASFYTAVTGQAITAGAAANTILTGHSLGGGLAGYITALTGTQGVGFDHMPFGLAAWLETSSPLQNNAFSGISTTGEALQFVRNGSVPLALATILAANPSLLALGLTEATLVPYFESQIASQTQLDSFGGLRSPVDLHSMALLAILQYAKDNLGTIGTDWRDVAPELWDAGFSNTVGAAAMAGNPIDGVYSAAQKMLTAIAYSAIDEGTRVFGDVGIRAMFNDADDLGRVVSMADASTTILAAKGALAEILVQFAGEMAFRKVLMASDPDADEGVLSVSPDNSVLTVDFSDALWSLGGGSANYIIGRETLTDKVIGTAGPLGVADTRTGMQWLWGDSNSSVIDRIAMATTNAGTVFTIPDRAVPSPDKATIFAAGGGNDTITGSKDNDFIVGGRGNDTMICCHDLQLLAAA